MPAVNIAERMCQPILSGAPDAFPNGFGILGADWMALTAVAMLVSVLFLALLYVFSSFLRNQQFLTWTKFEIFQVFATGAIIAFTAFVIIGMCSFDMGFLDSARYSGRNMYEIVQVYFDDMQNLGLMIYGYIGYVAHIFGFLSRVVMMSNPLGVGSQETPLESLGQVNSLLFYMLSGFVISYILTHLQMRMLEYLAIASLYYMFPFGIFFRAFEPTRKFGGTLIGFSIAMFLFYPVILVFNDYLMLTPIKSQTGPNGELREALNLANDNSDPADYKLPRGDVSKDLSLLGNPTEYQKFVSESSRGPLFLLTPVMIYFLGAVILPVINFIVLIGITRNLTQLFGEEIDVSNLTRLI